MLKISEAYLGKSKYDAKNNATVMVLSYDNIIGVLNSMVDNYVSEYTILNDIGNEYIPEKDMIKIIEKITANILEDMSDDVFIMCSSVIKSEKLAEVINRKVVIAVTNLANQVNKTLEVTPSEQAKRDNLNSMIRQINIYQ